MIYTIETYTGDVVAHAETLVAATESACKRLEDDPEAGGFEVWENPQDGSEAILRKHVTHGPDADWQSVVVVLEPGEKVQPPVGYSRFERIPETGGLVEVESNTHAYDPSDPKHPTYHERMAGIWDDREKV